jgi:Mg-chelatase subunit ChlD
MPAPSLLKGLPKPILFGLYGAVGGLLGALLFAEPLWQVLRPPPPPPPGPPEPQVAVAASREVEVFVGGRNTFPVEIDRAGFDGPVQVRFEATPPGVTINPLTIAPGQTKGEATVVAARTSKAAISTVTIRAEGEAGDKKPTETTSITVHVSDPARPQADVVFVLDVTGSMGWAINGVRDGIRRFADDLARNQIDFQVGLVAFRDLTVPTDRDAGFELMEVLKFRGEPLTSDADEFRREVSRLTANGGGDEAESSLEAIAEACRLPLRKSATKVFLLITDAPPKIGFGQGLPGGGGNPIPATADLIKKYEIDAVHLVVQQHHLPIYRPLMDAAVGNRSGRHFELRTVASGGAAFDSLLGDFSRVVAEAARAKNPDRKPQAAAAAERPVLAVQGVQSSAQFAKGTEGELILAIGLWTGAIAGLVCLALLVGQTHYLRGHWPSAIRVLAGLVGGLFVGLVGGVAGQGLFMLAPESPVLGSVFRILGWTLLGGLAGVGLSLIIPNLRWTNGLLGGAIGGALGAVGFLAISSATSDLVGRLIGGLILGFSIGLMVAIVEAAFRQAWLEVRFGNRETITVNLGPEPVKIGGDAQACTVWARGAEPIALRYFIRNGQVICEDAPSRTTYTVGNGDSRVVGNVTVTVRTGTGSAPQMPPTPTRPTAPVPTATPAASPSAAQPQLLDLDPIEPQPTPVPASAAPSASPPRPAAPSASPPRPAAPSASPPRPAAPSASPPRPAAPSASPRDPDACPVCGRKNPGRPGSRYCMMCDQMY